MVEQLQKASNDNEVATLRASISNAEMQATVLKQGHDDLAQKCQQYEEHIKSLNEKRAGEDAARNAQLAELEAQLQNANAARSQALAQLSAMDGEREALAGQLTNENAKYAQLQHKLQVRSFWYMYS